MTRRDIIIKWVIYSLIIIFIMMIQLTGLGRLCVFGVHPMVMPLVAASLAVFEGPRAGGIAGFFTGFMCDALIPPSTIFFTLIFMCAGIAIGYVTDYMFKRNFVTALMWMAALKTSECLLFFFLFYFLSGKAPLSALLSVALPEIVFSLLFSPIIYFIIRTVYMRFYEEGIY